MLNVPRCSCPRSQEPDAEVEVRVAIPRGADLRNVDWSQQEAYCPYCLTVLKPFSEEAAKVFNSLMT